MAERNTEYLTIVKASFRASDYSEEDIERVRSLLAGLGSVRLKGLPIPAAGGSAEIWLVLEFIGLGVTSGMLQHFGSKFYDRLAEGLQTLTQHNLKELPLPPQVERVNLSYDDLDISISLAGNGNIKKLPKIVSDIHKHMKMPPLSLYKPKYISLPIVHDNGNWRHTISWAGDRTSFRYWGISRDITIGFTDIYDSRNRIIIEDSYHQISSFLYTEIARLRPGTESEKLQEYVNKVQSLSVALDIPIGHDPELIQGMIQHLLDICEQVETLNPEQRTDFLKSLLQKHRKSVAKAPSSNDELLESLLRKKDAR